jgi:hypothetical protein
VIFDDIFGFLDFWVYFYKNVYELLFSISGKNDILSLLIHVLSYRMSALMKTFTKQYPNYSILFKIALDNDVTIENINNIFKCKDDSQWLDGVKKWYTLNYHNTVGLTMTFEQVFNTIFYCINDLKKGQDTSSKQLINTGEFSDCQNYDIPIAGPYILTNIMIDPDFIHIPHSYINE